METALNISENLAHELTEDGNIAHPISILDVEIGKNAMITIGLAVQELAAHAGVTPKEIIGCMDKEMYWLEPAGTLMIVMRLAEADLFLEIPEGHWSFKDISPITH